MKSPAKPVRSLLDRVQRRFARSRPGSVLIMVVALLVLMALIGTAYITMARSDRYAAQQHSYNTQIDMLVDGVINTINGILTQDVMIGTQYRPASSQLTQSPISQYANYTGVGPDAPAVNVW